MKKKLLTVIFPTFNRPHEVVKTLSILRANIPHIPYEVIICDNSTEEHDYLLNSNEYCFRTYKNMGAAARNIGIEKASAPYILMLDDDSHPLPGSIDSALEYIKNSDNTIAGITAKIVREDGGEEIPPLLPTVFHGCGVLFKTEVFRKHSEIKYPESFCFYGEEYFLTLLIYKYNYKFLFNRNFIVCHRMSEVGRNKEKILYYLTINNRRTWHLVPDVYYDTVVYDTTRRYELIAEKENAREAFDKAMKEDITDSFVYSKSSRKMTHKQFEDFALISLLKEKYPSKQIKNKKLVFCGCGKLPTLWANILAAFSPADILIADTNPAFHGKLYGKYRVLSHTAAIELIKNDGYIPVLGYNSRYDTTIWIKNLALSGYKFRKCGYMI